MVFAGLRASDDCSACFEDVIWYFSRVVEVLESPDDF